MFSAKIQIIGNVGRGPESSYTPTGNMVTKFSVAVNIGFGDKQKTNWYDCVLWGEKQGETIKKFVQKGSELLVDGNLELQQWNGKEGEPHFKAQIDVRDWRVTARRKSSSEEEESTPYDQTQE